MGFEEYFKYHELMRAEEFGVWLAAHLRKANLTDAQYAERLGIETHLVTQCKIGYIQPCNEIMRDLGVRHTSHIEIVAKTTHVEVERNYYEIDD